MSSESDSEEIFLKKMSQRGQKAVISYCLFQV